MIDDALKRALLAFGLAPLSALTALIAPPDVGSIRLEELTLQSPLIVVAKVNKLVTRTEGTFANATPMEVWRGSPEGDVEFIVSSTFACDISQAIPGEKVLLFLETDVAGRLSIAHFGRGRLPLDTVDGKDIARCWGGVILPEAMPVAIVDKSRGGYSTGVELAELERAVSGYLSNGAWSSVDSWYRQPRSTTAFVAIARDRVLPVVEALQPEAQRELEKVAAQALSAAEAERLVGGPLPAEGQCVLLRSVVLNEGTGAWDVSAAGESVLVNHGCLGRKPVPMKRKAIVAVLAAVPSFVFVTCDMAE